MSKRFRAVCAYCGKEWDDILNPPKGYEYGASLCDECADLADPEMETIPVGELSKDSVERFFRLNARDRAKFKGSPCDWCGKKSIMRVRRYPPNNDTPMIIASCEEHVNEFKEIVSKLSDD